MPEKPEKPEKPDAAPKAPKAPKQLPKIVKVVGTPHVVEGAGLPNVEPKTTAEEDRLTAGQRRINLTWELTQAVIAVCVSLGTILVSGVLILREGSQGATTAFLLLSNAFFMIVTAYFQRTNHTRSATTETKPKNER